MTKCKYSGSGKAFGKSFFLLLAPLLFFFNAKAQDQGLTFQDTRLAEKVLSTLTQTMIRDITSPPVASRDYVYSMIAFYEAARPGKPVYKTFAGRLNGLTTPEGDSVVFPSPEPGAVYNWLVAGTAAFHKTAYALVFSKDMFQQLYDSVDRQIHKKTIHGDVYERSVKFGEQVATVVLKWTKQDQYGYTRTLPRFTPSKDSGTWQQTGPEYMEAVEPHWDQIRPMSLSKAHQFTIPEPAAFKSEAFTKEYMEVYQVSMNMTKDQRAIALFWDCNPYAVQTIGHLMYSIKKISPGGHWIGITSIAINREKQGLVEALYSYSLVSIAVFDGFIGAWDEKYRSNYVRPITAIQQKYAPTWQPLLQTPPFPEYPSAHSVISMASAMVLTGLYGDHFHYVDSVEKSFGLPNRSFHSFVEAAGEAAMSRLYGGIHFREAVENGELMGKQIGQQIVEKFGLSHPAKL